MFRMTPWVSWNSRGKKKDDNILEQKDKAKAMTGYESIWRDAL